MIRYQIRNEYGLSDPGLCAPGEKDDPEALLEGVAMAGLVGVLRQLGDLAEFAAEIFHDLHEEVMATASRGHGLMLRLQQLEADFPAVEKAIISQTDHSNYPHDEGIEWHANLQLNQNMMTQGDMPRFILDSYEECRGPPRLFTLDKFDVAGAGASLKRYSDPSFFKTEHASYMIETKAVTEKRSRKKKKAMRWRKGETLEALLVANSESHTTTKERTSRKVPPRTTKLKYRHPRDSDCKNISRICTEHLQEVISSQQKCLFNYSASNYHAKFRSTDLSETTSAFGELDNFSAPAQSSAKLELTKVFPMNEYDTMETASTPTNGSACLEADDGPAKGEEVGRSSLQEQNDVFSNSKKLQEGPDVVVEECDYVLQSAPEGKLLSDVVSANQDVDRFRTDDTGSDQDNFVDALNNMEPEGGQDAEMKTKRENALHTQFSELGHAVDLSPSLNDSCSGGEPTCVDSFLINDSSPAMSTTMHPSSDPTSCRQSNGVDWTKNEEPSNDVDLMDVSSSSSVHSDDNGNFETNDGINGCEQYQEAFLSSNDDHAAVGHSSDKHQPQKCSGLDGFTINSNDCIEKAYHSVEHDRNFELDATSRILGEPNDVSQNNEETEVGNADDSLLHSTISNQEDILKSKKQFEGVSLHTSASLGKVASLPDMDLFMLTEDLELDNVAVPNNTSTSPRKVASLPDMDPFTLTKDLELDNVADPKEFVTNTAPEGLGPDYVHEHLDEVDSGVAPIHSSMLNNPLYESHDNEIVEELHSFLDEDLYKHVEEDNEIVPQEKGSCSTSSNTIQEDPMQASVSTDLSNVQEFPRFIEAVSPLQEDSEAHIGETLVPSSCMLNDDRTTPLVGVLACSNAFVLDNISSCVEHHGSTEKGENIECDEVLVDVEDAEESTTSRFADDMVPFKEKLADGAKYTEKTEFVATNPREEDSRHGVQSQHSSPCREELETVDATYKNIGSLDETTEHIYMRSMLRVEDPPQHIETEISGETVNNVDDTQNLSSLRYPNISVSPEDLPEETSLTAEVLYHCDLDKDGSTVDRRSNMVVEKPVNADQDLLRVLPAEDTFGTNPFMDPGYKVIHTDPSPSMSYQPCFSEEEQDFISEILIQHGSMGGKENLFPVADSLWEPATPPDEAPLPSEVMTEEDFQSFCHEYHEMDFTSAALDDKPVSDSNDISNDFVTSKLEFPYSASALTTGLYQEASVCSNSDSQVDECSFIKDMQAENSEMSSGFLASELEFPYSASALQMRSEQEACVCSTDSQVDECSSTKEDPDDWMLGINSDLKSHEPFSDKKIAELDVPSVPMELKEEQNALPGADSLSGSCLLDEDKIGEKYGSPSGNIIPVKEEREICFNLVPRDFINENIDKVDVPPGNPLSVEPTEGTRGPDDCDYQDVPCSITNEIGAVNDHPLSKPVQNQESEVLALGQLDSQAVPSSLINEVIDNLDVPPLNTDLEAGQESEDHVSGEHNSQITTPFLDENIDELDAPTLSNIVLVEKEPKECAPGELASQITSPLLDEKIDELDASTLSDVLVNKEPKVCVPGELAPQIASCSSSSEEIYAPPLSNSVLVQLESEDHLLGALDSQITPRSSVNDKIDEPDTATHVLPVEVKKEACLSPELGSQIAPCSLNDDKVSELDGPPPCNAQVEAEKEFYCSTEVDSEIAPCSSDSGVLAGKSAATSTSVMPSTKETYGLSHVQPSSETLPYASYEDPQKPPPLPPLQWRLGRPCLGLLSTKGRMPESVRRTSPGFLPPNPEMDNWPGSLNGMAESKEPVSSLEIKERHQNSMVENNDQRVEFRRLSTYPTVTDVARTEQVRSFSEACENFKHQEHASSSETYTEEHHNDTVITDGVALHPTNPLLLFPAYEHGISQQGLQGSVLSSGILDNSEHPSYTHRAVLEDDKTVDDHNATGGVDLYTMSPAAAGHVSENGCYQHSQHDESHSENSNDKEHALHAPHEETDLKAIIASQAPSNPTNRSALGFLLEEGNLQEHNAENLKGGLSEDPLPSEEPAGCQDYPCDGHNLEAEDKHQPNQCATWPGDNNYICGPHEDSHAHAEQPPVMGWTVGPQMLHPYYGISMDENQFEQNVADHRPIKKPISVRNIPRNPLVDAVAAHDRSTMRKVSELVPPSDKPKPNERNLLLEQIRKKTFNLKPVGSTNPTTIRASTRNLRVAAIIEKANAIRQAVGSDDEDGDNWSDT